MLQHSNMLYGIADSQCDASCQFTTGDENGKTKKNRLKRRNTWMERRTGQGIEKKKKHDDYSMSRGVAFGVAGMMLVSHEV